MGSKFGKIKVVPKLFCSTKVNKGPQGRQTSRHDLPIYGTKLQLQEPLNDTTSEVGLGRNEKNFHRPQPGHDFRRDLATGSNQPAGRGL
jgi:hypothetical protein